MADRKMLTCQFLIRAASIISASAALAAGLSSGALAQTKVANAAKRATAAPAVCRVAVIDGQVLAGQIFERPIGNDLRIFLEPLSSGWLLRVLPAQGPRGQHDYAELATPPYQSVSPLLVSTDYSFRAQDALAWNPRHFRFASDRKLFESLLSSYEEYQQLSRAAGAASTNAQLRAVEARLAMLAGEAAVGEFDIVDARLLEGTADQARTAGMVASHLNHSAHQVEQPTDGAATPLGRLNWLKFRIRLELPFSFEPDRGLKVNRSACF